MFEINFHHQVSLRRKDKQLVAATEKVFVNKFVPVVVFVVMVAFLRDDHHDDDHLQSSS